MNKSAAILILLVAGLISNTMGQYEPYQDVLLSTKTFALPVEDEVTAPAALAVEEADDEEAVTDLDELVSPLEDTTSLLLAKQTTRPPHHIQPIQVISQLLEEQPLELEIVTLPLTTTTRVRTTTPPATTTEEVTTEQVTTTEETTIETTTEKLITTEVETTTHEETPSTQETSTTLESSTSTQIPVVDLTDSIMLDHQTISVEPVEAATIEYKVDSKTSELLIDSMVTYQSESMAPSSPVVTESPTTESTSESTTSVEPSTSVPSSSLPPSPEQPSSSSYSSSSVPVSTIIPTVEITTPPVATEKVILDELATESETSSTSPPSSSTSSQESTTLKIETTTEQTVETSTEPETVSSTKSSTVEPSTTIYYTSSQPLTRTESIILATVNIKVAVPLKNSSVHSNAASNKDFKVKADGIIQNEASSVNKICILTGVAAAIISSLLI